MSAVHVAQESTTAVDYVDQRSNQGGGGGEAVTRRTPPPVWRCPVGLSLRSRHHLCAEVQCLEGVGQQASAPTSFAAVASHAAIVHKQTAAPVVGRQ